ncbi:MAG: imidazole glycerol phosphate synthase subunit HisF [Clostridiales bacterium 38-18]|nr:MAG: imidazole glycerol phosphate synthase subunit HisF [Clostridiales bacterium 38-18]
MLKKRVMPCLLLKGESLVKSVKFKDYTYIGDPINAVKIFNDCEVDELVLLDITATTEEREPNFDLIAKIVDESFVPLAYGGGVKTIEQMAIIFKIGVEKIIINSLLFEDSGMIAKATEYFGAQSIVVSIDVKKNLFGKYEVFLYNGKKKASKSFEEVLSLLNQLNVGEVLINDISRDGMMEGYNLDLIAYTLDKLNMPVIAIGGAGELSDLEKAFDLGIQALAAGSLFVYKSRFRGVLINYPNAEIEKMR